MGGTILDSAQVEARVSFANGDAFVAKHADTEPRQLVHPSVGVREVFVIARYEEDAVTGAQVGEGRNGVAQLGDAAVDQIAGYRDDVGRQRVGADHDVLDDLAPDRRADVEIRDLYDRQPVLRARQ